MAFFDIKCRFPEVFKGLSTAIQHVNQLCIHKLTQLSALTDITFGENVSSRQSEVGSQQ